jgi:hypothetical protein
MPSLRDMNVLCREIEEYPECQPFKGITHEDNAVLQSDKFLREEAQD